MSFQPKKDWFGLVETLGSVVCSNDNENRQASTNEEPDENGDICSLDVFDEHVEPSADYHLSGDITAKTLSVGSVTTTTVNETPIPVKLANVSISTGAGTAPAISASGVQVESGATGECVYSWEISLSKKRHAQILDNAFSFTGDAKLNTANYAFTCEGDRSAPNGVCIAHGSWNGKIVCDLTLIQVGAAKPVLTAGENWEILAPLSCENPDSQSPRWTAQVVRYLKEA